MAILVEKKAVATDTKKEEQLEIAFPYKEEFRAAIVKNRQKGIDRIIEGMAVLEIPEEYTRDIMEVLANALAYKKEIKAEE